MVRFFWQAETGSRPNWPLFRAFFTNDSCFDVCACFFLSTTMTQNRCELVASCPMLSCIVFMKAIEIPVLVDVLSPWHYLDAWHLAAILKNTWKYNTCRAWRNVLRGPRPPQAVEPRRRPHHASLESFTDSAKSPNAGGVKKWRDLQRHAGLVWQLDEHQLKRSHLHIQR